VVLLQSQWKVPPPLETGDKISTLALRTLFACWGDVFEKVAVILLPFVDQSTLETYLPLMEPAFAIPAEALVAGQVPWLA
jgi:hypothetical protein